MVMSHSTKGVCRALGCAVSPGLKGVWGLCGDQVPSKSQRMVDMDVPCGVPCPCAGSHDVDQAVME